MNTTLNSSKLSALLSSCALIALAGCGSSTHFTSRWSAQNAQPVSTNSERIATVFITDDESVRRAGEDQMAEEIRKQGGSAFPSYTVLATNPRNAEQARAKLEDAGVDAVVSMRVVNRERVADYGPSYWTGIRYYDSLWGYWGHGWDAVYSPGYVNTSLIFGVETLLYSLKDGTLLWAGMSETVDKETVKKAVKSIARRAVEKMHEDRVLATN